jgi:hypothetical protein
MRSIFLRGLVLVVLAAAGAAIGWAWLGSHPIHPGLDGCMQVRHPGPRVTCLRDHAAHDARTDGIGASRQAIRHAVMGHATGREARRLGIDCHLATHAVGEFAGRRSGPAGLGDIRIDAADPCDQGFLHGYVAAAWTHLDAADLRSGWRACNEVSKRVGECAHAFGHAFVHIADPARRWHALHRCAELFPLSGRTPASTEHDCMHGGTMEIALLDLAEHNPGPIDPCDSLDGHVQTACYGFLPGRDRLLGRSWSTIVDACGAAHAAADQDACAHGLFAAAAPKASCRPLRGRLQARCEGRNQP